LHWKKKLLAKIKIRYSWEIKRRKHSFNLKIKNRTWFFVCIIQESIYFLFLFTLDSKWKLKSLKAYWGSYEGKEPKRFWCFLKRNRNKNANLNASRSSQWITIEKSTTHAIERNSE
jgi:hypothetical protein